MAQPSRGRGRGRPGPPGAYAAHGATRGGQHYGSSYAPPHHMSGGHADMIRAESMPNIHTHPMGPPPGAFRPEPSRSFFSLPPGELGALLSNQTGARSHAYQIRSKEFVEHHKERAVPYSRRVPFAMQRLSSELGYPGIDFASPSDPEEQLNKVSISTGYAVPIAVAAQYGSLGSGDSAVRRAQFASAKQRLLACFAPSLLSSSHSPSPSPSSQSSSVSSSPDVSPLSHYSAVASSSSSFSPSLSSSPALPLGYSPALSPSFSPSLFPPSPQLHAAAQLKAVEPSRYHSASPSSSPSLLSAAAPSPLPSPSIQSAVPSSMAKGPVELASDANSAEHLLVIPTPVECEEAHFRAWLQRLADPATPLSALLHYGCVPYLARSGELVRRLCDFEVPLGRITWYVSAVFFNSTARRRVSTGVGCEWTKELADFVAWTLQSPQLHVAEQARYLRSASQIIEEHCHVGLLSVAEFAHHASALLRQLKDSNCWPGFCAVVELLVKLALVLRLHKTRLQLGHPSRPPHTPLLIALHLSQLSDLSSRLHSSVTQTFAHRLHARSRHAVAPSGLSKNSHQHAESDAQKHQPDSHPTPHSTDSNLLVETFRGCALGCVQTLRQVSQLTACSREARSSFLKVFHGFLEAPLTSPRADKIALLNAGLFDAAASLSDLAAQLLKGGHEADVRLLLKWALRRSACQPPAFQHCATYVAALLRAHFADSVDELHATLFGYMDHTLRTGDTQHCSAVATLLGELSRHGLFTPRAYMRYLLSSRRGDHPGHRCILLHTPFLTVGRSSLDDVNERRNILSRGHGTAAPPLLTASGGDALRTAVQLPHGVRGLLAWCRANSGQLTRYDTSQVAAYVLHQFTAALSASGAGCRLFADNRDAVVTLPVLLDVWQCLHCLGETTAFVQLLKAAVHNAAGRRVAPAVCAFASLMRPYWRLFFGGESLAQLLWSSAVTPTELGQCYVEQLAACNDAALRAGAEFLRANGQLAQLDAHDPHALVAVLLAGNSDQSRFSLSELLRNTADTSAERVAVARRLLLEPIDDCPSLAGLLDVARLSLSPRHDLWPLLSWASAQSTADCWQLAVDVAAAQPYRAMLVSLPPAELVRLLAQPDDAAAFQQRSHQDDLLRVLVADGDRACNDDDNNNDDDRLAQRLVAALSEWTLGVDCLVASVRFGSKPAALARTTLHAVAGGRLDALLAASYFAAIGGSLHASVLQQCRSCLETAPITSSLFGPLTPDDDSGGGGIHALVALVVACLNAECTPVDARLSFAALLREQLICFANTLGSAAATAESDVLRVQQSLLLRLKLLAPLLALSRKSPDDMKLLSAVLFRVLALPVVHVHSFRTLSPSSLCAWILAMIQHLIGDFCESVGESKNRANSVRLKTEILQDISKTIAESACLQSISEMVYVFLPFLLRSAAKHAEPARSQSTISALGQYYVGQSSRRSLTYSSIAAAAQPHSNSPATPLRLKRLKVMN